MLQELLFVGFLDDYTGIIHKPFPHQRGVWWCADGSCLKTFHVQVFHYWADGRAHGSTFNLLLLLVLESAVSTPETKFQETDDILYCHGCSSLEPRVFFRQFFYDGEGKLDGHWCEKCLHIIWYYCLIWTQLDIFQVLYEIFIIVYLVRWPPHQGLQDLG